MKKIFNNNGASLTMILALFFFVMSDLTSDYLPGFLNSSLTYVIYFVITMLPISLSIYFKNKK